MGMRLTTGILALAFLLCPAIIPTTPLVAQEPDATPGEIVLPDRPGGIDMDNPVAVKQKIKKLTEEKEASSDNEEKLGVLNLQIGVLERQAALLEVRQRQMALPAVTEQAVQAARADEKRAKASLDALDLTQVRRDLQWSGSPETARGMIEKNFTAPLKIAREKAKKAAEAFDQRTSERKRLPEQQQEAEEKLAEAIAKISELVKAQEAARADPDFPVEEFNLLRDRIDAWQQDAVHQKMRREFLARRAAWLDNAVPVAKTEKGAAESRLERARRLADAAQTVLDELVAKESLKADERIRDKRDKIERARFPHLRSRGEAELENLELDAEQGKLAQRATSLQIRRGALEEARSTAVAELGSFERRYAPGAASSERPRSEEVSAVIRRLDEETDPRAYRREMDGLLAGQEEAEAALDSARSALEKLDADFEALIATARAEFEAEGAGAPLSWPKEEGLWQRVKAERRRLLEERVTTLESILPDYEGCIEHREQLNEARRQTLILFRRENLFLRGKSHITWKAFTSGLEDLGRLPAWVTGAGKGLLVWAKDPGHRIRLIEYLAAAFFLTVIFLYLRRRLRVRILALAEGEKRAESRMAIVLFLLLRPFLMALVFLGVFFIASVLLPSLPDGFARLLRMLGAIFAGFWFARAANKILIRGESEAGKVVPLPPEAAKKLSLGVRLLLFVAVLLVPIHLTLQTLGYANEGAVELVGLTYKVLIGLILIGVVLRRRVIMSLLPMRESKFGRFLRLLVVALHPVVVVLIPALLLLEVLRYDILAGLIAGVAVNSVVVAVVGFLLYRGCLFIVERKIVPAAREPRRPPAEEPHGLLMARFILRVFFLVVTTWALLASSGTSLEELRSFFNVPLPLQSPDAEDPVTLWNLFAAVSLLVLFLTANKYLKLGLQEYALKPTGLDRGLRYTITTLTGYVVVTVGILLAIRQVFDLSSLGYLLAALTVGIGFGLQEVVSNFISGIILLFERSVKVGDLIEVGTTEGVVRRIQIRSTTVLTRDNIYVTVPNKTFITDNVVNYTGADSKMRLHVPLGASYDSDPLVVRRILEEVAAASKSVRKWPAPSIRFTGFGDSSIDFDMLVWIDEPVDKDDIKSDIYYEVFAAFKEQGIEIPFPQRDLHVRSAEPIPFVAIPPGPSPRTEEE